MFRTHSMEIIINISWLRCIHYFIVYGLVHYKLICIRRFLRREQTSENPIGSHDHEFIFVNTSPLLAPLEEFNTMHWSVSWTRTDLDVV